jgi:hypothetical protein
MLKSAGGNKRKRNRSRKANAIKATRQKLDEIEVDPDDVMEWVEKWDIKLQYEAIFYMDSYPKLGWQEKVLAGLETYRMEIVQRMDFLTRKREYKSYWFRSLDVVEWFADNMKELIETNTTEGKEIRREHPKNWDKYSNDDCGNDSNSGDDDNRTDASEDDGHDSQFDDFPDDYSCNYDDGDHSDDEEYE